LLHTDALDHNADFILVDETWFTDKQRDADVSLPGFNLFRSDRKSRIGGGICIYVLNWIIAFLTDRTQVCKKTNRCDMMLRDGRSMSRSMLPVLPSLP